MKRLALIFLLPISSFAQSGSGNTMYAANGSNNGNGNFSSASAYGSVNMPTLMSIDCSTSPSHENIVLNSFESYNNGVVVPYFVNINVKCNRPWVINMMADGKFMNKMSSDGSPNMPVGIYSLKSVSNNEYIALAPAPQTILRSENNLVDNSYSLDLRLKPEYGYQGGQYGVNIIFTLSPQ